MGLNVRLEQMTVDEVAQLAYLDVTSDEGIRLTRRAQVVCGRPRPCRIMSEHDLAEALHRST